MFGIMKQRIPLYRIFQEKEFWLLILLGVIYFYRPLFMGETFFFRDLYLYSVADKQPLLDFLHSGELPLWNPYLLGGQPYLGNIASSAFYPSDLLFAFLPLVRAFNVNIVLHFLLSLGAAYAFARVLTLLPLSSFLVGIIYGFSGCMLSSTNLPGIWFDMPYFPLLFLFWHLFLLENNRRWLVISVIVGTLQALAGSPEPNAIVMLSLLGWTLFYPYPHQSFWRRIRLWTLLGGFTVGLTFIIIIPTVEMVLYSGRQASIGDSAFSWFSLHPKQISELLFPWFLGDVNAIRPQNHYWGWRLMREYLPFFLNIYFGWVVMIFAYLGAVTRNHREQPSFPRSVRMFFLLFSGSCFLLSIGSYWPFFQELYPYLPFHSLFRSPVKLLLGTLLPLALLAGYGAELYFSRPRVSLPQSKNILYGGWVLTFLLAGFAACFRASSTFSHWFVQSYFHHPSAEEFAIEGLKSSSLHAAMIVFLGTLLFSYRQKVEKRWQYWLFTAIVVADLLIAGQKINFYAPDDFFTDIPDIVPLVQHEIGEGRLFRTKNPTNFSLQAPSDELMWLSRWNLEVLSSYLGYLYEIPVIFYEDPNDLGQAQIIQLWNSLQQLPWPQKIPILSSGAVSLVLTTQKLPFQGLELIAEIPNRSNLPLFLYRNLRTAQRVEFVTDWETASSDDEALEKISASVFDPRRQVILQTDKSGVRLPERSQFASAGSSVAPGRISQIDSTSHSTAFSVSTSQAGYLVFTEPYYPGWHITIDGKETHIWRANYAFSAVFLPKGQHEILRWYRPDALMLGALGSLLTLLLFIVVIWKGWV